MSSADLLARLEAEVKNRVQAVQEVQVGLDALRLVLEHEASQRAADGIRARSAVQAEAAQRSAGLETLARSIGARMHRTEAILAQTKYGLEWEVSARKPGEDAIKRSLSKQLSQASLPARLQSAESWPAEQNLSPWKHRIEVDLSGSTEVRKLLSRDGSAARLLAFRDSIEPSPCNETLGANEAAMRQGSPASTNFDEMQAGQPAASGTPRLGSSCESSAPREELARAGELLELPALDVARPPQRTRTAAVALSEQVPSSGLVQRPIVVGIATSPTRA